MNMITKISRFKIMINIAIFNNKTQVINKAIKITRVINKVINKAIHLSNLINRVNNNNFQILIRVILKHLIIINWLNKRVKCKNRI